MTAPAVALPTGRLSRLRRSRVRRGWRRLRRRVPVVRLLAGFTVGVLALAALVERPASAPDRVPVTKLLPPLPVLPVRLSGVVVHAKRAIASKPEAKKWKPGMGVAPVGERVAVEMTAYCLKGRTRRGNYVRPGIIAADPRVFPLAKYVELYVGQKYVGRFLVDDTGGLIKGTRIDIWTPTCREAILFGRRRGTAILVPRGADAAPTPEVERLSMFIRK